jgi:hypothetical protein
MCGLSAGKVDYLADAIHAIVSGMLFFKSFKVHFSSENSSCEVD